MSHLSEERKRAIIDGAETLLPNRGFGEGHNFILSTDEAYIVGSAVATRNHRVLRDVLSDGISQMEEHYDSFQISELKDEWATELSRATGMDGSTLDFVSKPAYAGALNEVLAGKTDDTVSMKPITYTKLLETIVYATTRQDMAEFQPKTTRPTRRRGAVASLHSRALHLLDSNSTQEPGIRNIREGLLAQDETALDKYLEQLSRMRLAQKALGGIIECFDNREADTLRNNTLAELEASGDFDETLGSHILTWDLLPKELADNPNRSGIIRKKITKEATTAEQKKLIESQWHDERIDVLFDIAHLATKQGRQADIYISSTFDGGAGLYLATALTHPLDTSRKIVVADNPINGNALYIVDEQLAEFSNDGHQYEWKEVLGTYKRIARARGARRRYHTGDWSQLAKAVCEYGGNYQLAQKKREEAAERGTPSPTLSPYEGLLEVINSKGDMHYPGRLVGHLTNQIGVEGDRTGKYAGMVEQVLEKLELEGVITLQRAGSVLNGYTVKHGRVAKKATPAAAPSSKAQGSATENTTSATTEEEMEPMSRSEQATLALIALQSRSDDKGNLPANSTSASIVAIIAKELKIGQKEASELNRLLGELGLRTSPVGRNPEGRRPHWVNREVEEVTDEMLAQAEMPEPAPLIDPAESTEQKLLEIIRQLEEQQEERIAEAAASAGAAKKLGEVIVELEERIAVQDAAMLEATTQMGVLRENFVEVKAERDRLLDEVRGLRAKLMAQASGDAEINAIPAKYGKA